ncbi:MAG: hypothetical protein OEZ16_12785 [Chromatiales bacterium]|nr:hypothetical protein [Chromatiales bacterium]
MEIRKPDVKGLIEAYRLDGRMMRYSQFVPRLYNYCKSLGFEQGRILPSRAFCSDESQGYPIILITKHFGTFPFNHGQVGGIVATDRHGPHAEHGQDMVIIQASHVGYDPATDTFGNYRRMQTEGHDQTATCGKVCGVTDWYQSEYHFAQQNIFLLRDGGEWLLRIDNQLLRESRRDGLFLNLDTLVESEAPYRVYSTSRAFRATAQLRERIPETQWREGKGERIGEYLQADDFYFKREIAGDLEGRSHLEGNLLEAMPYILTSAAPLLTAAQVNTQAEFDRTFRTIVRERGYRGKRLLFISGLNIDISPAADQIFPLTKFVPWAAYVQNDDGTSMTLEQDELMTCLLAQSSDNPDQIALDNAIHAMEEANEVVLKL